MGPALIWLDLAPHKWHDIIKLQYRYIEYKSHIRISYHWGQVSSCWRPSRHWLNPGLSFCRSPVWPVVGGLSVWRPLGPVFCVLWLLFFFVCLFVCRFFSLVNPRLFNSGLGCAHASYPFRFWRKFICIKSPWETHDSDPCLNGSSIINC